MPRRLIGYDRYGSKEAYARMDHLYRYVRLYVNYFQPVSKLIEKERDGAKVKKKYDEARTPYQRLLASGLLDQDEARRATLARLYASLNPAKLHRQIEDSLEVLWKLTDRKIAERKLAEHARGAKQAGKPMPRPILEPAGG